MSILGPNGKPIRALTQPAMGHYDSFEAAALRLPQYNPDLLLSRQGIQILDEQLKHVAVRTPLSIVRNAVLYKGVKVEAHNPDTSQPPPPESQELADALTYALNEICDEYGNAQDPRSVVWELLYAIHVGFHVTDILWRMFEDGPYKNQLGFAQFASKPAKQIGFDLDERTFAVKKITSYVPKSGYDFEIPAEKFLRYTHEPQDGLPHGKGVGVSVYKHTWSLDFILKFWNIGLELYGIPFLMGFAPEGATKAVWKVLKEIRQGAPPVFPQGSEVTPVEVTIQNFDVAAEWHSKQCSLAYVLSTLTSDEGQHGATSAGSDVHADTREYGLAAKRMDIEFVLNTQLVRRWVLVNYGAEALAYAPRITLGDWDEADAEKWASAVQKLVQSDVLHPDEPHIRERLNAPPLPPELKADMQKRRDQKQKLEEQKALRPPTPGKEN